MEHSDNDSIKNDSPVPEKDNASFEQEFVHKFYSEKSKVFSDSRVKAWPFIVKFIEKHNKNGSVILDSGCGNGRQFIAPNIIGLDYSPSLLMAARGKPNIGLVRGTVLSLPFRSKCFDIVLSIAVVHHLSTEERRMQCMDEMHRVLKDDGRCLLYAWHVDSSKKKKFSKMESSGESSEYLVSWRGENDALRYYHLYTEEMLRSLCEKTGFVVEEIGIEQESVYAVIKKR
ncbi:tRNA (uracil-5-)-methyltransferase TRM9 [Enteropsectra breve]|nr:tRNA (uracil-5-)-methyltransferase TRM9 [Enteropsectra breve]